MLIELATSAWADEVEITGAAKSFDRRKPVELIAYLALHGKAVSDDRLKTALWPEREPTGRTFNTTVTSARPVRSQCGRRQRQPPDAVGGIDV
jgi:DNA-binding SARP family transcriptional activator